MSKKTSLAQYPDTPLGSVLLLLIALLILPKVALADLMLFPTRVVLEPKQRSTQLQIINKGDKLTTYRISIVNRRMTETGEIIAADEAQAGEQFASNMLRFSPRQVTLKPGATQTIRISVRKPASLPAGEYRSHLQFDQVPDTKPAGDLEVIQQPEPGQLSIILEATIGVSIPVIVRHGQTSANASLEKLALEPARDNGAPMLNFIIQRNGNRSVYGDIVATYILGSGEPMEIARVGGVAVYVPNAQRLARLPLKLPDGVALKGGKIHLKYVEQKEVGANVIAQSELTLP